jgi:hypothetical protein
MRWPNRYMPCEGSTHSVLRIRPLVAEVTTAKAYHALGNTTHSRIGPGVLEKKVGVGTNSYSHSYLTPNP